MRQQAATAEAQRVAEVYAARSSLRESYPPLRNDVIANAYARSWSWARTLQRRGHELGRVVDLGCGSGGTLGWALASGASTATGVDLLTSRLRAARAALPTAHFVEGNVLDLPHPTASVDTILCSTLFSSVGGADLSRAIVAEIDRTLAPGGVVLWFDLALPNPSNVDVVPFPLRRLRRLWDGWEMDMTRVALLPPLARQLQNTPRIAGALASVPLLCGHLSGALWRP